MNLKKKVFGFVATAALTFSMIGGAAATPGQAVLAPTQCEASEVSSSGAANFGTWQYDGINAYLLTSGQYSNEHLIAMEVRKVPAPGKKCAVTIAITQPLSNNVEEIPNSHFSLSGIGSFNNTVPATFQQERGTATYLLTLNNVPAAASTGTYNGTVTTTVSNGS